jgi:hypothetical protein
MLNVDRRMLLKISAMAGALAMCAGGTVYAQTLDGYSLLASNPRFRKDARAVRNS